MPKKSSQTVLDGTSKRKNEFYYNYKLVVTDCNADFHTYWTCIISILLD